MAFESSGSLGEGYYRVLAPDWIWQGQTVSILLVLTAREATVRFDLELDPPEAGFAKKDAEEGNPRSRVLVGLEQPERFAFSGWEARSDVPLGTHEFRLRLGVRGETATVVVPVRTVRGSAVPRGWWSILVPAAIALLAVPGFLLVLRRHAAVRAWRTVGRPAIPAGDESWWREGGENS